MGVGLLLGGLLLGPLFSCTRPEVPSSKITDRAPATVADVSYEVWVDAAHEPLLRVKARYGAGLEGLLVKTPSAVTMRMGDRAIPATEFARLRCEARCDVDYDIDLAAAARQARGDIEIAAMSGDDAVVTAATWLLPPDNLSPLASIRLTVHAAPGQALLPFEGGSEVAGGVFYQLRGVESRHGGYAVFGSPNVQWLDMSPGVIRVVQPRSATFADPQMIRQWVETRAQNLKYIFGQFPTATAQVVVMPAEGTRGSLWGRTRPWGGASIVVQVGTASTAVDLGEDWVLQHEFVHLAIPSFVGEGAFVDEGFATYYEQVIRLRSKAMVDQQFWENAYNRLPAGFPEPGDDVLADSPDRDRIYWGGAMFALWTDANIRRHTDGQLGLEDGLRASVSAGMNGTRIMRLDDFATFVDEVCGQPLFSDALALAQRGGAPWDHADRYRPFLNALGVVRTDNTRPTSSGMPTWIVALEQDAPEAWIRRSIETGGRPLERDGATRSAP